MNSAKLMVAAIISFSCHAGFAQDASTKFVESEIKAAIEEAAVLNVCPDQALLELAEIVVTNCRTHIAKLAPLCWNMIDRIIPNYAIEQSEMGKERFISILAIYASCVRAELLGQIVESSRESRAP